MKPSGKKILTFVLIIAACAALASSADHFVLPWLSKINFTYRLEKNSLAKSYLDALGNRDKLYLQSHLDQALSELGDPKDPREVAAAINDYLFQSLLCLDHTGTPVQILRDGHAICGGHAITMITLLELAGVKSSLSYLLDVPYQGAHSLVQVEFSAKEAGLFDPTFGVLWYEPSQGKYLCLNQLKEHPEWAESMAWQTIHPKRQSSDQPIAPFRSLLNQYQQLASPTAMHYGEIFKEASYVGLHNYNFRIHRRIPMQGAPSSYGQANPANIAQACQALASSKDPRTGEHLSLLQHLGKFATGFNVSHLYEMENLEPGNHYQLCLDYLRSTSSHLSVSVLKGKLRSDSRNCKHDVINDFGPRILQTLPVEAIGKSRRWTVDFMAEDSSVTVLIDNEGDMLLHSIRLTELEE